MSITLPPTVHERLARCGTRVFVDGIVPGATVELHVDVAVHSASVTGTSRTFDVPPLSAGAVVRARQDIGGGFTAFSPSVTAENAFVPPEAAPTLPERIAVCSQCVLVTHATPGAFLDVRLDRDDIVGAGIADRHGEACVPVDLRRLQGNRVANLTARQILCGAAGPWVERTLMLLPSPTKPHIHPPLFGCQKVVSVSNITPGAILELESDTGDDLGKVCSCWSGGDVYVLRRLMVGEHVRARGVYDANPCNVEGPWSAWALVEPPDERIKPEVLEPLMDGDQLIRVDNQSPGAMLLIRIAASAGMTPDELGPRPTSDEQEIALSAPLVAGNVVTVVQTLCDVSLESDAVTVQPAPPAIVAPVVVPPMYACGQAVQVSNLHLGALVRVFMDGVPVGLRWAGLQNSITVQVAPALVAGRTVTAKQFVGTRPSPESAGVLVSPLGELFQPRILGPVAPGDRSIWVSGVTPGSHLMILMEDATMLGEVDAAETVVRVPISHFPGLADRHLAIPRVRLCDKTATGPRVESILSPCHTPPVSMNVTETTIDLGDFEVPATSDGGGITIHLRGLLYTPDQLPDEPCPLVVIAHGWHERHYFGPNGTVEVESFKGYGYLAHHLVRWGMVVFSVDLQELNDVSPSQGRQQFARAEVILHVIDVLRSTAQNEDAIDATRVGLVGHSVGGEAVALTQSLNVSQGRGFGIRGVVSIAPTRWHPEVVYPEGRYMQIFGSIDQLTRFVGGSDVPSASGGMRIYDRAERDKTMFWVYGLRHNPFNSLWVAAGDYGEQGLDDLALPAAEHERVAKCLINAFFQESLFGREEYRGYLEGTVLPEDVRHIAIHASHSRQPRHVLDNFGDQDIQAGTSAEAVLDKTLNSRGQPASASGAEVTFWEDQQHSEITNSPHSTAGLHVAWSGPLAEYRSDTGSEAHAPTDVIGLRVAQFFRDDLLNPVALPADVFLVLTDGAQEASVRLGSVARIPYPDSALTVLSMMRTVRVPLDAFVAANPALNLNDIRSVTLRFNARPAGNILADDFEFSP
jgi:dienelactone hydrolase